MSAKASKDKIVFLDRDGVINEFPGNGKYVTKVKDFHFIPGSLDAIRALTEDGYNIFVISNQAGVGKGVYSQDKLKRINTKMVNGVLKHNGALKKVFYCTHRSDHGCDCRKPGIGSVKLALKSLNKTIHAAKNAYFVGDTGSDIEAGHNAGCTTIFVLSGRERRRHIKKWNVEPDHIVKDLYQATQLILKYENSHHSRNSGRRT